MNQTTLLMQFCNDQHFRVFNLGESSLSYCFLQIAIEIPIHFILALVSTLLLPALRLPNHAVIVENCPKWFAHGLRLTLTLTVIFLNLYEYWSFPDDKHPPDIAIISMGTKTIAWLMVFLVTYKLIKLSPLTQLKNLSSIVLLVLSALISSGLHLQWTIQNLDSLSPSSVNPVIVAASNVALTVIFVITLLPRFNRWHIFRGQLFDSDLQNLLAQPNPMTTSLSAYFTLENHESTNWLSRSFFTWVNPLLTKGYKQKIKNHNDLFPLPANLTVVSTYEKLLSSTVPNRSNIYHDRNSVSLILWKTLFKAFGSTALRTAFLKILADLFYFGGPLVLEKLILYIEDDDPDRSNEGFYYCAILLCSTLISSISISLYNFQTNNISIKITSSISALIYSKILYVRNDSMISTFSSGEIINFISTDAGRVTNFYPSLVAFLTLPLQLAFTLYLLHSQLGLAFVAGLLLTLIVIPINKVICDKIGSLNVQLLHWKDKRVKLMSEMLSGIRLVKMQAWENVFEAEIEKLRNEEMKYMKKIKYLDALCVFFWATTPLLISLSTFTTYVLLGNQLTAAKVFTSLALFNMLINPLNAFPWVLNGLIEACISVKRIQKFLDLKEMKLADHYTGCLKGEIKLNCVGSFFKRDVNLEHRFTLGPIDLLVKSGEYVGIVGSVGSGKSSLFSAIIGEMHRASGTFQINDHDLINGIGYVPQDPWIQNSTIRENIIFGQIFDSTKYNSVIDACALTDDLKIFPNGDATLVGDRGVTLSGGQKARIALARAVYQDFDIYLLDDPYSSVDAHVAEHIRTHCIDGLLSAKTRLISTHHTEYLSNAQLIVVMDNGLMIEKGSTDILAYVKPKETGTEVIERTKEPIETLDNVEKQTDEVVEKGKVKFDIYKHYWLSVGPWLSPFILVLFTLMQTSRTGADWWLSHWTTSIKESNSSSIADAEQYLGVFAGITLANSLFTLFRAFFFAFGGIVASKVIHTTLLRSTLTSSISFFDTTAFGRIINRFSSDITNVDDRLPFNINILITQIFSLLASIFVTLYGIPWTAVAILPLFIPYFFIQKYYRWTSRDMKRLCAVSLSPIYSQLAETIHGVSVVRAFAATGRFINNFVDKINISNACNYAFSAASQWLNIRLQILGVIFSCGVALTAVILHYFSLVHVNAGLVGLALAYSLTITGLLNDFVQMFAQVEVDMISVERIQQYVKSIDKEFGSGDCPENWPRKGEIVFDSVSLRYKPESPLALDGINLTVKPRQHVGIIGRTGSGKSTLLQTLFRIKDLESGRILIDGIDISSVNVRHVRSALFIVPQDSYLFSGSIRHNLDPLRRHSDDEIWKALRQCQADSLVLSLGSLNAMISENGRDLSFGQRQLICLTRASLSRAKVICFDEITSSIDRETDQLLEKTIRSSFKHSTILTVAHKIETIINCDRVLVMEGGKIVEDGDPQLLKNDLNSKFHKLWSSMQVNVR